MNTEINAAVIDFINEQYCTTTQIIFTLQSLIPSTIDGVDAKRRLGEAAERMLIASSKVRLLTKQESHEPSKKLKWNSCPSCGSENFHVGPSETFCCQCNWLTKENPYCCTPDK